MPPFKPIKQRDLVKNLKKAGFDGPYSGGKHPFMVRGDLVLTIPNPHKGDIVGVGGALIPFPKLRFVWGNVDKQP